MHESGDHSCLLLPRSVIPSPIKRTNKQTNKQTNQVRFRDISRGGLRVVAPPSKEVWEKESERHYDEVYSLAFAQQLKNKDIPEGGSKAVLLMKAVPQRFKEETMRKTVKAFTNSLIDLISTEEECKKAVVDRLGRDERLYLGPDENIIPHDITWVVDRARQRGFVNPDSFMSSKPDAGINHKEFGTFCSFVCSAQTR